MVYSRQTSPLGVAESESATELFGSVLSPKSLSSFAQMFRRRSYPGHTTFYWGRRGRGGGERVPRVARGDSGNSNTNTRLSLQPPFYVICTRDSSRSTLYRLDIISRSSSLNSNLSPSSMTTENISTFCFPFPNAQTS